MNLPNLITIARILMVPLTVWLIISDAFGLAFLVFVLAGVSDGIDGFIAKHYNQRTELGAHLDPLADKALLVSVYVTLGFLRVLPAWLVIIVVSRDVLIVGAFILSWLMEQPVRVQPLVLSKVNTAGQILLVVTLLGATAIGLDLRGTLLAGEIAVAILTVASGGQYLYEWVRHMAGATT
ncbi:MAG: CDP-alcohol phosphatidyltransferase family protein [Rhizobiales bacterium]|nr:CDP-alcohol phosphatidyltransferase family protein [Hyphomicrobiales bacterium]MBI3674470.1 CDP-alcohol phosphatidyltransferase family protein [Hyphomicrobiales bacterium]